MSAEIVAPRHATARAGEPWCEKSIAMPIGSSRSSAGKIKSDLRKYITHGEMIGKTGGEFVSIPLPQIEIPEFRYGTKNRGGVGQGPGDVGTPIGRSSDGEAGQGGRRGARATTSSKSS